MKIPRDYKCSVCGATGCKLWRDYGVFSPRLFCCDHAAEENNKDISNIKEDGTREWLDGRLTDQIGWTVPAIPSVGGYWGYTSIPEEDYDWWVNLPLRVENEL